MKIMLEDKILPSCYRTANNKHLNAPAKCLTEEPLLTTSSFVVNNLVIKDNNVSNSYSYRMFLQQNANKIMGKKLGTIFLKEWCL